jgi:hypothetical protein
MLGFKKFVFLCRFQKYKHTLVTEVKVVIAELVIFWDLAIFLGKKEVFSGITF